MSPNDAVSDGSHDASIIDTLQSLIVAFVLAMTFRGFVTEGFVIPTGSMAPTLMGAHLLMHSEQTGITFPVGLDNNTPPPQHGDPKIVDPSLGPGFRGSGPQRFSQRQRMGDRILVLKSLYPFSEPDRFDVVVFKNPTEPVGDSSNYIKRLIGLPREQVWIADGDVFAAPLTDAELKVHSDGSFDREQAMPAPLDRFRICRKPEHVQRAVWQLVHLSDHIPISPEQLREQLVGARFAGPPWIEPIAQGQTKRWRIDGLRSYSTDSAESTTLEWANDIREINDWTAYNMAATMPPPPAPVPVSDVRVSAGIIAQQSGFATSLQLLARGHIFEFSLSQTAASIRMRSADGSGDSQEWSNPIELPSPGSVFNIEFWHVDQSVAMYLNSERLVYGEYEWSPHKRLQQAVGAPSVDDVDDLLRRNASPARMIWHFAGSPVTLHQVRVDRDLHYRHDMLKNQPRLPLITGHAFGTHPTNNPAILGPDQFMMGGDNSQMSLDSRLWGNAHAMIQSQVDVHPFTVHRDLLLGKAWVVYFPAPFGLTDRSTTPFIPDFGRLRFIR